MAVQHILIIGDGVIGLSAAWKLARAGNRVTCIGDDGPRSTDAAAGMLAPSFERHHPRAAGSLGALLEEGLNFWPDFARELMNETGQAFGYDQNGIIGIGFPSAPSSSAIETAPPAGFPASRAWLVPEEGQADPRLLRSVLLDAFGKAGGTHIQLKADAIECGPEGISVRAGTERFMVDRIVLAGGVRSAELLPDAFEMEGVRGRAFLHHAPELKLTHVVRTQTVYFCPKADGLLYIGATEEIEAGEPAMFDGLWWEAVSVCPPLQGTERLKVFDGVRPALKSGLPKIGHWAEDERVYLALGHDRNGVLLAPLTADRVVLAHCL